MNFCSDVNDILTAEFPLNYVAYDIGLQMEKRIRTKLYMMEDTWPCLVWFGSDRFCWFVFGQVDSQVKAS